MDFERGFASAGRKKPEAQLASVTCQKCGKVATYPMNELPNCCNNCGMLFGSFKQEWKRPNEILNEMGKTSKPQTLEEKRKEQYASLPPEIRQAHSIFGKRPWQLEEDPDVKTTLEKEYRKLSKIYHPDLQKDKPENERMPENFMKELNLAYETLKNIYVKKVN